MPVILLFMTLLLFPGSAWSHPIDPGKIYVEFRQDGTFEVRFKINLEAHLAAIGPLHDDSNDSPNFRHYDRLRHMTPSDLQAQAELFEANFRKHMSLKFDDERAELSLNGIDIPESGDLEVARITTLVYQGRIPATAVHASWRLTAGTGSNIVYMTHAGEEFKFFDWIHGDESSTSFRLNGSVKKKSLSEIFTEYFFSGIRHIVPLGLDHILFVLGLFLLTQKWKPLLWQITAFTLSHSVTLTLTVCDYISLSPSFIEPLIAVSLVYVGLENILSQKLHLRRILVVFVFGLLHGMGFASVLVQTGLPEYALGTALLSFNAGVEAGQILVVAAALVLTRTLQRKPWFRKAVVIPASSAIALTGFFWAVERMV